MANFIKIDNETVVNLDTVAYAIAVKDKNTSIDMYILHFNYAKGEHQVTLNIKQTPETKKLLGFS